MREPKGGGGLPGPTRLPSPVLAPPRAGPLSRALPVSAVPAKWTCRVWYVHLLARLCGVARSGLPPLSSAAFPRLGNAGDCSFSLWGSLGVLRVSRGIDHALGGRPLGNGGPVASGASSDDVGPVPLRRFPPPRSPAAGPQPRRAALCGRACPSPPLRGEVVLAGLGTLPGAVRRGWGEGPFGTRVEQVGGASRSPRLCRSVLCASWWCQGRSCVRPSGAARGEKRLSGCVGPSVVGPRRPRCVWGLVRPRWALRACPGGVAVGAPVDVFLRSPRSRAFPPRASRPPSSPRAV